MLRWTSFIVAVALAATAAPAAPLVPIVVLEHTDDFDAAPGPEWSVQSVSTTPDGERTFLGELSAEAATLTLTLPPHTAVSVELDLLTLKSWDGNGAICCGPDRWTLAVVDDAGALASALCDLDLAPCPGVLLDTTFSTLSPDVFPAQVQSFPDAFPASHPAFTGAAEVQDFGYAHCPAVCDDAVYHLAYTVPHVSATLVVRFTGAPDQALDDESWGLDSLRVVARLDPGAP